MPIVNLPITGDAYVSSYYPDQTELGTRLSVQTSNDYRTFIKFPTSEIPSGKYINSAKLYLTNDSTTVRNSDINMYNIIESWNASSVTYNNKPAFGTIYMPFNVTGGEYTLTEIDVTQAFKANYDIAVDYGVTLFSVSSSDNCNWGSSRNTVQLKKPYMVIEYFDSAPSPPSLTAPIDIAIDVTKDTLLKWTGETHTDAEIIWNDGSDHTVNLVGNLFEYTIPANTINVGNVTWKVKQKYSSGSWSEYSSGSFTAATKPATPTITTAALLTKLPIILWSSTDQAAFKLKVYNGGTVEDVTKYVADQQHQLLNELTDSTQYTIALSVANAAGLWSDTVTKVLTSNFTKPATPTFTMLNNGDNAEITVTNGANTEYNEVLKFISGEGWVVIDRIPTNDTGSVYELESGKTETLQVRAYHTSGGYADSTTQTITITVPNSQIRAHDGSGVLNLSKNPTKSSSTKINATSNTFAGRDLPVAIVGGIKDNSPRWSFEVFNKSDISALDALVGKKALFRDSRSFIGWYVITSINIENLRDTYMLSINGIVEVNR